MANKKIRIRCETYVQFEFDPDSQEFKDSLQAYRKIIDRDGDEESMLKQCAHHFAALSSGFRELIEGVGYVAHPKIGYDEKATAHKNLKSGITVLTPDPMFDYEIE